MSIEEGPRSENIRATNIYRKANLLEVIKQTRRKIKRSKNPELVQDGDMNVQRAAVRVLLLEDVCKDFYENGSGEKETKKMRKTPHEHDAVILGILSGFRAVFKEKMKSDPIAGEYFGSIQHFLEYGNAVMYGLIACVPHVYKQETQKESPPKDIAALMRKKPATQMFSQLSNIAGKDAVAIEKILGLSHYDVNIYKQGEFALKSFGAHHFSLEDIDTTPTLVPSEYSCTMIAEVARHPEESVYSCLAHYVEVPGTKQTFFQYMHDLMTERYCKYVLGVRAKRQ